MRYRSYITILLLLFSAGILSAQTYSEKKTYMKSLPVNRDMALEINNKYGNIHITSWSTDSVEIKAEVEAYASDHDRLDKMFREVDVNITGSSFLIRAETNFKQSISMLFEAFKGLTSKIIPYESKLQINYFINAPEYLDIRITNKYGDVYMENNSGTLTLSLSNGAFKANSLKEIKGDELLFCNATINKINDGRLSVSFSEIEIGESLNLNITSISSKLNLEKAETLRTESRRDKYYIGTAGSLTGDSYFTDFRIEELQGDMNIDTRYGEIDADFISKDMEIITINSNYTDISLTFDPSISYNLDIRHLNAFLVLPDRAYNIEEKTLSEERKEYMTYGTVGRNPGNTKVIINATRGNIYIK